MTNEELIKELSSVRYAIHFIDTYKDPVDSTSIMVDPAVDKEAFQRVFENIIEDEIDKYVSDHYAWESGYISEINHTAHVVIVRLNEHDYWNDYWSSAYDEYDERDE